MLAIFVGDISGVQIGFVLAHFLRLAGVTETEKEIFNMERSGYKSGESSVWHKGMSIYGTYEVFHIAESDSRRKLQRQHCSQVRTKAVTSPALIGRLTAAWDRS
jgi:hypothetical protein